MRSAALGLEAIFGKRGETIAGSAIALVLEKATPAVA
jgi:hypothetical protein